MTHPSRESCSPLIHFVPEVTQITSASDGVDVNASGSNSASISTQLLLGKIIQRAILLHFHVPVAYNQFVENELPIFVTNLFCLTN